ncbi:MAG: sigma factor G inhibitor Gin [archaeon]|nr:sigma factor G inhibitor Gin [archaeon]
MTTFFEEQHLEYKRRGAKDKWQWMEKMDLKILPSQKKRIQVNDKTVWKELIIPPWVTWELLFSWATKETFNQTGKECIICNNANELGVKIENKFICQNCFVKLKQM